MVNSNRKLVGDKPMAICRNEEESPLMTSRKKSAGLLWSSQWKPTKHHLCTDSYIHLFIVTSAYQHDIHHHLTVCRHAVTRNLS